MALNGPGASAPAGPIYGARGDVLFGNPDDANGEFSLAWRVPVVVGDVEYPTAEHCFQVCVGVKKTPRSPLTTHG